MDYRKHNNREIQRWADQDRPKVWFKKGEEWFLMAIWPSWMDDKVYIVNDKHADLRKQLIDNPDLKVEIYSEYNDAWYPIEPIDWDMNEDYRLVYHIPKTETRWRLAKDGEDFTIVTDNYYSIDSIDYVNNIKDGWYKLDSIEVTL